MEANSKGHVWTPSGFCVYCHNVHKTDKATVCFLDKMCLRCNGLHLVSPVCPKDRPEEFHIVIR
jgi:hypothetical protein